MISLLDDPALIEDEDRVGGQDRREPVCDHDRGAAREQRPERGLDQLLGERVQM